MGALAKAVVGSLVLASLVLGAPVDISPDVTKAAGSEALTVVLENEQVRVLRYQSKPGHVVAMHTHPGPQIYVALSNFRRRITRPDGSAREIMGKVGDALWVSDPTPHQGEDTGEGTHFVIVEIKAPRWSQVNAGPGIRKK